MVDAAPLITLRRVFALLVLFSTARFVSYGWVGCQLIDPIWTFPFEGFGWLPRPSKLGAVFLFGGMFAGGFAMLHGRWQRFGSGLFFICFTYVELLDKSNYLNHYYLVSIMALLLTVIPAKSSSPLVPRYALWTVKIILCLIYFYAGIAKLNADWLLRAQPLAIWLPQHSSIPFVGEFFAEKWVAYTFSWGGAIFDLSAPFALCFSKTRQFFYPVLVAFHLMTWWLFPIGIFPWVMICCTTVFFGAHSHRKFWALWRIDNVKIPKVSQAHFLSSSPQNSIMSRVGKYVAVIFLAFQILIPLRPWAYSGSVFWNESGYRFGWRVMLMEKAGWMTFYVVDELGREKMVDLKPWLTPNQEKMISTQPDMLVQLAQHIKSEYELLGEGTVKVRAEVWVSLNGRRSQLFLDPFTDLSAEVNDGSARDYVLPMDSIIRPTDYARSQAEMREKKGW